MVTVIESAGDIYIRITKSLTLNRQQPNVSQQVWPKRDVAQASLVLFFFIALGDPGKAGKNTWTVQVAPVKSLKSINYRWLGGGNSNIFLMFTPKSWGRWTHFDEHIFQGGWFNHQLGNHQCFHKKTHLTAGYLYSLYFEKDRITQPQAYWNGDKCTRCVSIVNSWTYRNCI